MTQEELKQWIEDLKAAERLQEKFPTASIRNIVQQLESIVSNEKKRRGE